MSGVGRPVNRITLERGSSATVRVLLNCAAIQGMFMRSGDNDHRAFARIPGGREQTLRTFEESIDMQRILPFKLALALVLAACVTVNVYFPSPAAEKAADQIIDTVTGGKAGSSEPQGSSKQESTPEKSPQTSIAPVNGQSTPVLFAVLGRVLEMLVPAAHAQASDANLDISTP